MKESTKRCMKALVLALVLLANQETFAQSKHRYSVGIGKSEVEAWHLLGRYQLYPSGRVGLNLGYIRGFNSFLMRPWYGIHQVNHTSISVEHSYFFKTEAKKVTPFYIRQSVGYVVNDHVDTGGFYQRLLATLALGIALEMKKHWGLSLDAGIAPIFWGRNNGRNMHTSDDIDRPYPFFQPEIRLQAYYWR